MRIPNADREWGYFEWLCSIVHIDQEERSYRILAKKLFDKPFYPLVEHDENRVSDGLELRGEYFEEIGLCGGEAFLGPRECSVFEMIIGLARRMNFETASPFSEDGRDLTVYWFWEMIENLGLINYSDDTYERHGIEWDVTEKINTFVKRKYRRNGQGGLFPLTKTKIDQRKVEIWYQMSAYLTEKEAM